jgi:hypothetical protein
MAVYSTFSPLSEMPFGNPITGEMSLTCEDDGGDCRSRREVGKGKPEEEHRDMSYNQRNETVEAEA